MRAHPYADAFPMLPADELRELADSIASSGLRQPVVVTTDGMILDGRNRAAACDLLGIEPETVVYEGDDLAEFVIDCNVTRRNQTTGQRAMSTAIVLAADGRRDGGRWRRGSVDVGNTEVRNTWQDAMRQAGIVLDFAPDLAPFVVDGATTLHDAYTQADKVRRDKDAEALAEKARKRAAAEQARKDAERDADLTAMLAGTKYESLIAEGTITPVAAWAAHEQDTAKERQTEKERDHSRRIACTHVAEAVRHLGGGQQQGEQFIERYYPHESRFIADGMRLTVENVEAAIDYLTVIRKALT